MLNVNANKTKKSTLFKKMNLSLYKPKTAVFSKIPLKKIEKEVEASTWVLANQKLNGHKGNFIPKPIINKNLSKKSCFFKKTKFLFSKK